MADKGLSDLAQRLLRVHAQRPDVLLYGVQALGGLFRESDMDWLDTAYAELEKAGLVENSGSAVSFFGTPRTLYRITDRGAEVAAQGSAA